MHGTQKSSHVVIVQRNNGRRIGSAAAYHTVLAKIVDTIALMFLHMIIDSVKIHIFIR